MARPLARTLIYASPAGREPSTAPPPAPAHRNPMPPTLAPAGPFMLAGLVLLLLLPGPLSASLADEIRRPWASVALSGAGWSFDF